MRGGPPSNGLVSGLKNLRLKNLSYYKMLYIISHNTLMVLWVP